MLVGIIGAMEVEVDLLKKRIESCEVIEQAGMEFYQGVLCGVPVVVVRCGVGKVNAAVCVQVLVDNFKVSHVLNTGVAGALDPALEVGDFCIAADAVQHDVCVTNFGYELGQVPGLPTCYEVDGELAGKVFKAAQAAAGDVKVTRGRVASGDQFINDAASRERVRADFDATCCEMEGAAIAQACHLNGVPFSVLRAISDKADGSNPMDYDKFEVLAARSCASIVLRTLESLAG